MTTTTLSTTSFATRSFPRISRYAAIAARCALGFVFCASGLAGLFNLLPPPPPDALPPAAVALGTAFANSGYLFPLIKGTEALAGALLLANCFAPLALTVLAPVIVNILAFHAFLTPGQVTLPLTLACIATYLAWTYRAAYRGLFTRRAPVAG